MDKITKIKSVLSELDSCIDLLNYDLKHNIVLYCDEDVHLLEYAIIELSNGYRNLSNIINNE